MVVHLVEDDGERDDEGVVDAGVDGDAVRVLPQQRAHHGGPPVDLRAATYGVRSAKVSFQSKIGGDWTAINH